MARNIQTTRSVEWEKRGTGRFLFKNQQKPRGLVRKPRILVGIPIWKLPEVYKSTPPFEGGGRPGVDLGSVGGQNHQKVMIFMKIIKKSWFGYRGKKPQKWSKWGQKGHKNRSKTRKKQMFLTYFIIKSKRKRSISCPYGLSYMHVHPS